MAFFSEVGKKISTTSQNAVNKAKEVAEVAKINSMISDEENKINSNYYQIGKLYVALHKNDCEDNFATMINDIVNAEKKIVEYREQIQSIKGIVKCPKCGAEVSVESAFCHACGAPMPVKKVEPTNSDMVVCAKCNSQVKAGMKFCTACGSAMEVKQPAAPKEKVCPACGFKTSDIESAFCHNCGGKLVEADALGGAPAVVAPVVTEPVAVQSAVQVSNTKKCVKCGFETDDPELLFCTECGTKF